METTEKIENRKYLSYEGANIYEVFVGSESIDLFMENQPDVVTAVDSYIDESDFFKDLDTETFDYVRDRLIKYIETNYTKVKTEHYQEPLEILSEVIEEHISASAKLLNAAETFIETYLNYHKDTSGLINASSELSLSKIRDFVEKYLNQSFFTKAKRISNII